MIFNIGADCCDTIETYALNGDTNSDISFFAYGTWTKMADKVNGYSAYTSDADGTKVMYFACSGSWRVYTLESIGDCNGYIFTNAETSCPHSEVQWNWSYWSGELGNSFAAKCLGMYFTQHTLFSLEHTKAKINKSPKSPKSNFLLF